MAEQEEDYSSLPLPDRFVHKVLPEESPTHPCPMLTNNIELESEKARL